LTALFSDLETAGFTLARNFVNAEGRHLLLRLTTPAVGSGAVHPRSGDAFAASGLLLDKHARANWTVPGHQDRIVAVAATTARKHRIRDGIAYAELDAITLAGLVALRIHFDPTDGETGALCVVPGSHLNGVMPSAQPARRAAQSTPEIS
jgi:hypothetical protein